LDRLAVGDGEARRRIAYDIVPGDADGAGVGVQQGGQDVDEGGLARAVGTDGVHGDDRVVHRHLPGCVFASKHIRKYTLE